MVKLSDMDTSETQAIPVPPNLIRALMAGFDCITNHLVLILFPIVLDLFLWLGPHLSLRPLIKLLIQWTTIPNAGIGDAATLMRASQEAWLVMADRFNLFGVLRTFPVGIPSLIVSRAPLQTPLGASLTWEISSFGVAIALWIGLSIVGTVAGAFYFILVSQAAVLSQVRWLLALKRWPWVTAQVLLMALGWLAIGLGVSLPFSCLLTLLLMAGINIGQVAFLIFGVMAAWLILPLAFTPHGIFVSDKNVWISLRESVRLTRHTFSSTMLLFLSVMVLSECLNVLWRTPPENSWLILIGLAGHAFVVTGLLAATFVYYQDASRWIQRLTQQAKLASTRNII